MSRTHSTHKCKGNAYMILVGKPKERDHHEDLDVGGKQCLNGS
jgi:hypothetical protein